MYNLLEDEIHICQSSNNNNIIRIFLNCVCACIFTEVGKNINQDKVLSLKRYVEDYHKYANSLKLPSVQSEAKDHQNLAPGAKKRKGITIRPKAWKANISLV